MLEVIRDVGPVIEAVRRRNPNLADQADRSLSSAPLNLREGNFALGKNRRAKYAIALSEWAEAIACFEIAGAGLHRADGRWLGRSFSTRTGDHDQSRQMKQPARADPVAGPRA